MDRFKSSLHGDGGQDLTEYGLLAAFIAVVLVATVRSIGPLVNALWIIIRDAIAA